MQKSFIAPLIIAALTLSASQLEVKAAYWLVVGSYRQGPGGKPAVSGITSPSVYAIPMETLEQCKSAGEEISEKIYKPVWNFDNRWTCVEGK